MKTYRLAIFLALVVASANAFSKWVLIWESPNYAAVYGDPQKITKIGNNVRAQFLIDQRSEFPRSGKENSFVETREFSCASRKEATISSTTYSSHMGVGKPLEVVDLGNQTLKPITLAHKEFDFACSGGTPESQGQASGKADGKAQPDPGMREKLMEFANLHDISKVMSDDHLPQKSNCLMPGTTPPPDGCKRELTASEKDSLRGMIASYEANARAISRPSGKDLRDLGAITLVVGRCIERISTAHRDLVVCGASGVDPRNKKQAYSSAVLCPVLGKTDGRPTRCTDFESYNALKYKWDADREYSFPDKYPAK